MAIKLTYTDGQESQYGDDTKWEVDAGVLKLGREEGKWSVLLSPSHWAVIEVGGSKAPDDESKKSDKGDSDGEDGDKDSAKDEKDSGKEDDQGKKDDESSKDDDDKDSD